jgi:hypothetical protein
MPTLQNSTQLSKLPIFSDLIHSRVRVKSQTYFMTGGLPPISSSLRQALSHSRPVILFSNWTLAVIVLMLHSLLREDGFVVYNFCWSSPAQLFSSPILRDSWPPFTVSDSRFLQPSGPGPRMSPRNMVTQLYSQALGSLFSASYYSQGYGGGIRTRLHTG